MENKMDILTEQEMAARVDYKRPLSPVPEERDSLWCIPFEYGTNTKGMRISIALAKTIAAELLMHVAEAEKRELRRYFDREKERGDSLSRLLATEQALVSQLTREVFELKRKQRSKKHKKSRM